MPRVKNSALALLALYVSDDPILMEKVYTVGMTTDDDVREAIMRVWRKNGSVLTHATSERSVRIVHELVMQDH